jgi:probable HAF family extracellular repeat protein
VISVLPTLGGNNGIANHINSRGQVVGLAENTIHDPTCVAPMNVLQFKPVIWEKGQVRELPTVPGLPNGNAQGINDNGQAVGVSGDCNLSTSIVHGLLWQHGGFTDLGNVDPTAINNRGQVIGLTLTNADQHNQAFLWQNGVFTDLGTVPGDVVSESHAINDPGQVVGQSCDANGNCRAFLWENGAMTDLNALIPTSSPLYLGLYDASGINSRGEIVGLWFQPSTGEARAFLAIPVPSDSK